MVILEGGEVKFDIDPNMKRFQNFQKKIILAWSSIVWTEAAVNKQGFIRWEMH